MMSCLHTHCHSRKTLLLQWEFYGLWKPLRLKLLFRFLVCFFGTLAVAKITSLADNWPCIFFAVFHHSDAVTFFLFVFNSQDHIGQ